jgi:hypothetical protein
MKPVYKLKIQPSLVADTGGVVERVRTINIDDANGNFAQRFYLMAAAMVDDIQHPEGSGATALEEIRRIESGEIKKIESDGNGWVTHITRDKVWFESLYNQGEGGEVSFAQYKLAVQTYVRFLSDPEHKTIEVPFPVE